MVLGGALGPGFGACDARGAAPLCVAGVALGDIHLPFTWQAWYKLTSTVVLRGRRGTYGTGWRPWAGIWRLWRPGRRATLRGRRAQPDIHLRFTWQAWHELTSTVVLRGRRGTYGTGWRRYPSSKLLGRRTGACLTARQWVKQSMTSGARALTQCGKKRVQMPGEPTLMWIFATSVCFWTVWLLDIFGKTCTVSVITVVLACDCDCVVSSSYTSAARYLSSMSSSSDAYIHTYMHTYMHTYIHTYLPFYIHTYLPTYLHTYIHTYHFTFSIFHHLLCLSFLPCPR